MKDAHHLFSICVLCWTRCVMVSCSIPSRLSFSKNGVLRMDGFSNPEQFDDEALSLWVPGLEDTQLDQNTAKYILSFIGDKFCQMVVTENTAATWVKKDGEFLHKWLTFEINNHNFVLNF